MEPLVDTVIEDPRWQTLGLAARGDAAAAAVLAELGMAPVGYTLCIMGCDDARITELNAEFREKGMPTNVLSWPSEERGAEFVGEVPELPEPGEGEAVSLGDIALAYETCAREAAEQEKSVEQHVTHLIVHGILHLLGFDHVEDEDAELMEATEVRILAKLGVADPYL